jgi:hypothetical protein
MTTYFKHFEGLKGKKMFELFRASVQFGVKGCKEYKVIEIETHLKSDLKKFLKNAEYEISDYVIGCKTHVIFVTLDFKDNTLFSQTIRLRKNW